MGDAWNSSWSLGDRIRRSGSAKLKVEGSWARGRTGVSGIGSGFCRGGRFLRGIRGGRTAFGAGFSRASRSGSENSVVMTTGILAGGGGCSCDLGPWHAGWKYYAT